MSHSTNKFRFVICFFGSLLQIMCMASSDGLGISWLRTLLAGCVWLGGWEARRVRRETFARTIALARMRNWRHGHRASLG